MVVAFVMLFVMICASSSVIIAPDARPVVQSEIEPSPSPFHFKDSVQIVSGFYSGQHAQVVQKAMLSRYVVKFNICDDNNNAGCVLRVEVSVDEIKKLP